MHHSNHNAGLKLHSISVTQYTQSIQNTLFFNKQTPIHSDYYTMGCAQSKIGSEIDEPEIADERTGSFGQVAVVEPESVEMQKEVSPEAIQIELPLDNTAAFVFCHQFCEKINEMHLAGYDEKWTKWTKESLGAIFSDEVVITFGTETMNNLEEVFAVYEQNQKAWHSRSSVVKMKAFDETSVTFVEEVTYHTWQEEQLKFTYKWKVVVAADGKVLSQEYLDRDQDVVDRFNTVVLGYLKQHESM